MTGTQERVVNLNELKTPYSREKLFRCVAGVIAEDTLEYVNMHSKPVIPKDTFYTRYGKRMLDFVLALLAFVVTFPINAVMAVITFFDVGRPVLFRQKRSGKDGKLFTIIKFRNMTNAVDKNGNLLPANQRVTKFGKFVRKTSLDELLNFWSILKGDMSIIGPRPLDPVYEMRYSNRHKARNTVRPGLECPIIIPFDGPLTWGVQFENNVFYAENVSLKLDVQMMFGLVRLVFDKKSTAMRGSALTSSFMGYSRDGKTIDSHSVPQRYVDRALEILGNQELLV